MFTYTDNEQLKKELKKCIIDNGYTAKQICDSLEMLPQTYQTLINKKNFSFADMKRILDAMGVELRIDFVPIQNNKQRVKESIIVVKGKKKKQEQISKKYNRLVRDTSKVKGSIINSKSSIYTNTTKSNRKKTNKRKLSPYDENYIQIPFKVSIHEADTRYIGISRNVGTPMHGEWLVRTDDRRHKTWCIYWDKIERGCQVKSKCIGSSKCDDYRMDKRKRKDRK